ncbi:MAG: MBL fold metallo-hydrolase, partial [Desulfobacterales bacterium]|nr:MBL fold metallo-hydrolase [Desulfobacterales bacterium]
MRETVIEQMGSGFFRVEIPLPKNPLKYVNSYILRNGDRSLIIDTGLNRRECLEAMQAGIRRLGVSLGKTDFFLTHHHSDHVGLVGELAAHESRIYLNGEEIELLRSLRSPGGFDHVHRYFLRHGFPMDRVEKALQQMPGRQYGLHWRPELKMEAIRDGDHIDFADYRFICVRTPGHSPGHTCLYEAGQKMLLSGDHILGDITPGIQCVSDETNPLRSYLASLEKVKELEIVTILPGHRRPVSAPQRRIEELIEHHGKRLGEVLEILSQGPGNAYQVASKMTWDLTYPSWNRVPDGQKWFATGEAITHLKFLEEK